MSPLSGEQAHARAKELATIALHAVVTSDDWATAATVLQKASDELGGGGVGDIIMLLCDTIIGSNERMRARAGGSGDAVPPRPVWVNTDTGRIDRDATAVPAGVRWAGQLVTARSAMDRPAYEALLSALPRDDAERSEHVARLLGACATAVKAERGGR